MDDEEIREHTLQMINDLQRVIMEKRLDDWIELFDDDAVFEWPFAPNGRRQTYRGKAAILAAMTPAIARAEFLSLQYFKVHPLLDPNGVIIEMGTKARFVATDRPYNQTYMFYIELRNGKIWRYREYWNAWTLQDAWGDRDDLNATWGEPEPLPQDRPYLTF
jgi:ketosteroid isomerase-like protein